MNIHECIELYQLQGLSFFPIPYKSKQADRKWKAFQARRPTPEEIATWGNGQPSNIAIVCGSVSGNLVILDADTWERFYELEEVICAKTGCSALLDYTLVSQTSKGAHIWLRTKAPVKSQKSPQLDIKGEGGYVIAPPSVHPSGAEYIFLNNLPILEIESLESIGIDVKQPNHQGTNSNQPGWVTQLLVGVDEGQRNDSAIKLAGYFRNLLPIDVTERILIDWNTKNRPPMPIGELQQVVKSSYNYPSKNLQPDNNNITSLYCPSDSLADTKRDKSVTDSVTKSLAERIEEWVSETTGWFSYEECDKEVGIRDMPDKDNRRQIFKRLKEAGKLENHPKNNKLWRWVNIAVRLIDFKSATKRAPLAVKYPFGIEGYFNTYPGNIIVLAGAADSGKTAFLLNFIKLNQYDFSIFYQSSEMGKDELASRLVKFEGIALDDWNFTAEERSHDFADIIRPGCVNIIDFLELAGDFYKVAEYMRQIHDKLAGGIALIALQKKRGAELGRGGDFGLEKPRLYLTMDKGKLTIQKAKNWTNPEDNPNGLIVNFKIVGGCKFILTEDWHKVEDND